MFCLFLCCLVIVFVVFVVLLGIGGVQVEEVLCIGFQKFLILLILICSQGIFECELVRQGIWVFWYEFFSGLLLFELFNVGNVDFFVDVVDIVLVFVQVVGVCLIYFVCEIFLFVVQVILVGEYLLLKFLVELKGKCIVVIKVVGSYYLLIVVLVSVGFEFFDIQLVYLMLVDGCVVFENGKVDVWVIWDFYVVSVQCQ